MMNETKEVQMIKIMNDGADYVAASYNLEDAAEYGALKDACYSDGDEYEGEDPYEIRG